VCADRGGPDHLDRARDAAQGLPGHRAGLTVRSWSPTCTGL
jgi:hypothetical protein